MSRADNHTIKGKFNNGLITEDELPISVLSGFNRHNFQVGRYRAKRVATVSRVRQESEISDMLDTNLIESGIMLTGGYEKPFINHIK